MAAHKLADVTVVADAGMISDANKKAIEAAGLSFILGAKIPDIPYFVAQWRRAHPDEPIPDGLILTQPRPAGPYLRRFGNPPEYGRPSIRERPAGTCSGGIGLRSRDQVI
jgi:hypothetical protein